MGGAALRPPVEGGGGLAAPWGIPAQAPGELPFATGSFRDGATQSKRSPL